MPEHIIDDECIDDPRLRTRTWFDEMRDRHIAEEKAEQSEPPRKPFNYTSSPKLRLHLTRRIVISWIIERLWEPWRSKSLTL